jgi:hypothetical protein
VLYEVAGRVQSKLIKQRTVDSLELTQVMVDPATVTLIISLASSVIKLIIKCIDERQKEDDGMEVSFRAQVATDIASDPTFFQRRLLRRTIRKHLGWIRNWFEGGELYDAVLETGKELNPLEMQGLLNDVEKNPNVDNSIY